MVKKPLKKMRQRENQSGSNPLLDILTFPVLGAPRLIYWLAKTVAEEANREQFDEDQVQGQLLELQVRYELGEISDEEYLEQETAILDKLTAIREAKEDG